MCNSTMRLALLVSLLIYPLALAQFSVNSQSDGRDSDMSFYSDSSQSASPRFIRSVTWEDELYPNDPNLDIRQRQTARQNIVARLNAERQRVLNSLGNSEHAQEAMPPFIRLPSQDSIEQYVNSRRQGEGPPSIRRANSPNGQLGYPRFSPGTSLERDYRRSSAGNQDRSSSPVSAISATSDDSEYKFLSDSDSIYSVPSSETSSVAFSDDSD